MKGCQLDSILYSKKFYSQYYNVYPLEKQAFLGFFRKNRCVQSQAAPIVQIVAGIQLSCGAQSP